MNLSTSDVLRLAALANLTLAKKEVDILKSQLSNVINYFEELKKLRTDDVAPTSRTTGLEGVLRDDQVDTERILSVEDATSGSEKIHNNTFVVAQVITKDQ